MFDIEHHMTSCLIFIYCCVYICYYYYSTEYVAHIARPTTTTTDNNKFMCCICTRSHCEVPLHMSTDTNAHINLVTLEQTRRQGFRLYSSKQLAPPVFDSPSPNNLIQYNDKFLSAQPFLNSDQVIANVVGELSLSLSLCVCHTIKIYLLNFLFPPIANRRNDEVKCLFKKLYLFAGYILASLWCRLVEFFQNCGTMTNAMPINQWNKWKSASRVCVCAVRAFRIS